jgi:proteasome accessory factor C
VSETAAQQLSRVLQLIPEIADGESHDVDELAARLDITRQMLLHDVISLGERFDEPGGFVSSISLRWDSRKVSAFSSHFTRPMRLSMRELSALELGLELLRRERTPEEWPAIDRALARLREAITQVPANDNIADMQHATTAAPGDEHLAHIHAAQRARKKLEICYRPGAATDARSRTVCPYSLVFAERMWYMVAFCDRSEAMRFFRLDRIEAVADTGDSFTLPADYSVEAVLAEDRLFHAEKAERMVVRYSPRIARWIAEREGVAVDADGALTLELPLADEHWAIRHVLQYGPDAELLSPESLRTAIEARLEELAGS